MTTLNLRIPEELANRLDHLAGVTHRTKSYYVRQALEECMDDFEDFYLAIHSIEKIKAGKSKVWSQEDLEAGHDLDN